MSLMVTKVLKNTKLRKRQEGKEGWRGEKEKKRGCSVLPASVFKRLYAFS